MDIKLDPFYLEEFIIEESCSLEVEQKPVIKNEAKEITELGVVEDVFQEFPVQTSSVENDGEENVVDMQRKDPIETEPQIEPIPKERSSKKQKIFSCAHCDLKFEQRLGLRRHLQVHTQERPYSCEICEQTFASQSARHNHMKNRHLNPTDKPRPSIPRFMYNQSWACELCEKVFTTPSKLQKHMRFHTKETPYECSLCGQKLADSQGLRLHSRNHKIPNEFELFKCLICGNKYTRFSVLNRHRRDAHRNLKIDIKQLRSYGCGICGKPYYTIGQAMVCSILGHDPTSLAAKMFRIKCEKCPPERPGYHSASALQRHWQMEHADIPFPIRFRAAAGFYGKVLNEKLPFVTINKEKAANIKENGPPPGKHEIPLFTEFDLLPIDEEQRKVPKKKTIRIKKVAPGPFTCEICGNVIRHERNYRVHIRKHKETKPFYNCSDCGKEFWERKALICHQNAGYKWRERNCMNKKYQSKLPDRIKPLPKSRSSVNIKFYNCPVCNKQFQKSMALLNHKRRYHKREKSKKLSATYWTNRAKIVGRTLSIEGMQFAKIQPTANVNDTERIKEILGKRILHLKIPRVDACHVKCESE